MKKSRILLSILLIASCLIAWISQMSNISKQIANSKQYIKEAQVCMDKGLYEKAINYYEQSLELREKKTIRSEWLKAYKKAYKDGVILKNEYVQALEKACSLYPKEERYWEKLLQFQLENKDYSSAYKNYKKATRQGVKSKKINTMKYDILYSFAITQKTYTEVYYSPKGYYTLYDDSFWGVMYPDGEWSFKCQYSYASPMNNELYAVFKNTQGTRLRDNDGVVQGIIKQDFVSCRAYGDGVLPIQQKNQMWKYLDCDKGTLSQEKYKNASSFINGCAIVSDGKKWNVIGTDYKKVGEKTYDDVKLHDNGDYAYKDIMIASQEKKYSLYNKSFEKITDFECSDMDIYLGEYIAFKNQDGKWGFVDHKGNVVIKPQYEKAKSFSNGLAAVSKNGKWGYINSQNDVVIDYQFLDAYYFTDKGVTFVSSSEGFYYMIKLRFN